MPKRGLATQAAVFLVTGILVAAIGVILFAQTEAISSTLTTTAIASSTAEVPAPPQACSAAASQEDELANFRFEVYYNGSWNATAIGYSNSTSNLAFVRCYSGDGVGWILVYGWNYGGAMILNLSVQKGDASNAILTLTGMQLQRVTTAPYGRVNITFTEVP